MNLSLPERTETAIQALVQQGAYPTPEKVIEAGIQALQQQEAANSPYVNPEQKKRDDTARHLHLIEGMEFDEEQEAMFTMFDRKGWDFEQRAAFIKEKALAKKS